MRRLHTLEDVLAWRLCVGCGACAHVLREGAVRMENVETEGLRPVVQRPLQPAEQAAALAVCPAMGVDHRALASRPGILPEAWESFGPVLEIWEGYAADPEIRFRGSSGGALTTLSWFGLREGGQAGVLHIGQDPTDATRNSVRLSRNRADLLSAVGSRYAPASVCARLDLLEQASGPCVVIAQPSEVAALRKVEALQPSLSAKVGPVLSFFCAGSPSREGTMTLLRQRGVAPERLQEMRYRGYGWPGMFATREEGQTEVREHMTYQESWAFLQRFRPYSTHLFPDGSGESADISCGDPWYRPIQPGEPGSSLIVVRTERGREFLRRAVAAGDLVVQPATVAQMAKSQENLTAKRGAVWGRVFIFRLFGIPAPRYQGFSLWRNWLRLSWRDKQSSLLGTLKRVIQRGYYRRR